MFYKRPHFEVKGFQKFHNYTKTLYTCSVLNRWLQTLKLGAESYLRSSKWFRLPTVVSAFVSFSEVSDECCFLDTSNICYILLSFMIRLWACPGFSPRFSRSTNVSFSSWMINENISNNKYLFNSVAEFICLVETCRKIFANLSYAKVKCQWKMERARGEQDAMRYRYPSLPVPQLAGHQRICNGQRSSEISCDKCK
jgi:hypothetical protein